MPKGMKFSMYSKIGTLGLTLLTIIFATLALMRPDFGALVIIIWCILVLIFKVDILTLELLKALEQVTKK